MKIFLKCLLKDLYLSKLFLEDLAKYITDYFPDVYNYLFVRLFSEIVVCQNTLGNVLLSVSNKESYEAMRTLVDLL